MSLLSLLFPEARQILANLATLKGIIMTNQTETKAILERVDTALAEAGTELSEVNQQLKDLLANGGQNTPEVDELLARIDAKAQALKDIVPNATPPEGGEGGEPA